jgi:hypothetical protein
LEGLERKERKTQMSEPTPTIPQVAEIAELLSSSPAKASTSLSILAHVGFSPECTPATPMPFSMVDRRTTDSVSAREICQFLLGLMPVKVWPVLAKLVPSGARQVKRVTEHRYVIRGSVNPGQWVRAIGVPVEEWVQ